MTEQYAHYIAVFSDDWTVETDSKFGLTHAWQVKGYENDHPFRTTGFSASLVQATEAVATASKGKHVTGFQIVETVATVDTTYRPKP